MSIKIPRAFISYSWDDEAHKRWVRELATKLRQDGIDVMLDQWGLAPGDQLPEFMERSLRENDYILIICTPLYKKRSEERRGGVGYEGHIITAEIYASRNDRKFIPILRAARWDEAAPSWLSGKYYIDLFRPERLAGGYQDLLKTLHGWRRQAPPLGRPPVYSEDSPEAGDLSASLARLTPVASNSEVVAGHGLFPYRDINNWGFCDEQKSVVVATKYDDAFPFVDGLALVKRKGKYGFVSVEGEEAIIPQYERARSFSEGLAAIKVGEKWGFVDASGNAVIEPKYAEVIDFSEGFAGVSLNGYRWGYIDKNGQSHFGEYSEVRHFSEGLACVRRSHVSSVPGYDDQRYIDKTGREVLEVDAFHKPDLFSEGLACMAKMWFLIVIGKYGFIDKERKPIIPFKYQGARKFSQGVAPVKLEGKWGFIDRAENKVIRFMYDDAGPFSEGMAAVKLDKWGFIDGQGREVVPLDYDSVEPFFGGVARVELNGKQGYVGKDGRQFFNE
jgi:hypothetical protein